MRKRLTPQLDGRAWAKRLTAFAGALACAACVAAARAEETTMDAGTLAHALDRLANTARVLYVAAHPDDENTRLLAYLANHRHVTAAYLSITRGGGGQNLIGSEQAELLDVIRTEELLAARRVDAAEQRFTNMRDFGFSKSAEETLRIWGHDAALADVVWVIRSFRPDVIIARFDENPPNHGHHTASAILAREAFAAAADAQRFPEQLSRGGEVWQAQRLLLNVPTWRNPVAPADAMALDVGLYDARLGLSYGELAARSRSQHKSQGFGRAGERGPLLEYFRTVAGSEPQEDILEGVAQGWARFGAMAAPLDDALARARRGLERDAPQGAIPALLEAQEALAKLPAVPRVVTARVRIDQLIAACAGLFVRATAARPAAVPGSAVPVTVEVAARRPLAAELRRVAIAGVDVGPLPETSAFAAGGRWDFGRDVEIPADAAVSAPFWLAAAPAAGRFAVTDDRLTGSPVGPSALGAQVEMGVGGHVVHLEVPVVYAWTDRVHGERQRSFLITPPATVTPARQAVLFPDRQAAPVLLRVRAGADEVSGEVALALPAGWKAEPRRAPIKLRRAGDEQSVRFEVTPPAAAEPVEVRAEFLAGGRSWSYREDVIDYSHIPYQTILRPGSLRLVPLDLKVETGAVGYIAGSGDTVADDLASVGIAVTMLDDEALRSGDLDRFAAIVVGIRAYNTRAALRAAHERLMRYVERGGVVVVQYNTTSDWEPLDTPIGPFPLTLGRGRVTDETAAMVAVDPEGDVLQWPNRITADDFAGWVQERGLYFGETFDARYQPVFRIADPGEQEQLGALLVATHGKGRYVYTGLAFFRQLPAGVPGAYRLFVNLIARDRL